MAEFGKQLPTDPLAKTEVVAGLSDCFLTSAALRRQIEELEVVASDASLTANEKETAKSRLLGEAAITSYRGCGLSLDTSGEVPKIVRCIRPEEDCPLRFSSIDEYGGGIIPG